MKTLIRIMSDLHLEFDLSVGNLFIPSVLDEDKETILILSGDIFHRMHIIKPLDFIVGYKDAKKYFGKDHKKSYLELLSERFRAVIMVCGNHDYYGNSFDTTHEKLRSGIKDRGEGLEDIIGFDDYDNCYLLENSYVEIDDIIFCGGTLWTNFSGGQFNSMNIAARNMNDYKQIRNNDHKKTIHPNDVYSAHLKTVNFLQDIAEENTEKQIFVITHHAPSYQSIHEKYRKTDFNDLYYSHLDHIMNEHDNIIGWTHGHVHDPFDYTINNCRVICNPRGYIGYEQNAENYNDKKLYEIIDGRLYDKNNSVSDQEQK